MHIRTGGSPHCSRDVHNRLHHSGSAAGYRGSVKARFASLFTYLKSLVTTVLRRTATHAASGGLHLEGAAAGAKLSL